MSARDVLYRFRERLFASLRFIAFRIHCKYLLNERAVANFLWMLPSLSHASTPRASIRCPGDSRLAAHHARRVPFPDMDGCVAAIWTPAAESLLQRGMRDHCFATRGFAIAQGLAQNQIAFRPMVMTGRGAHQNITRCPLPYSFQRKQTIFDV